MRSEYIVSPTTGRVLHIINRAPQDEEYERDDIVSQVETLQVARVGVSSSRTFANHAHLGADRLRHYPAQECLVVMRGMVTAQYYDEETNGHYGGKNVRLLRVAALSEGDVSITLRGGHGYTFEQDTHVIEIKNGPYYGREADKVEIPASPE